MAGSGLLYGILGLGALAAVASGFDASPVPELVSAPVIVAPAPKAMAIGAGLGSVTLQRAPDSHFYAEASVNGAPVRFLVDTGASSVVLTRADALRAGIGAGNYDARAVGAGGEIRLMPAVLARLALGPVAADNVPAMVAEEGALPVSLLGQSYLERLSSVEMRGETMVLR